MEQRQLGTQGLAVSAIGLGCMGMSDFYGADRFTEPNASAPFSRRSIMASLPDTSARESRLGEPVVVSAELDEIQQAIPRGAVAGDRYPAATMSTVNR